MLRSGSSSAVTMKLLLIGVLAAAGLYGLLAGLIAWQQDRLLYLPSRATLAQMQAGGLRAWPAADDFRALLAEADRAHATAIVFHGNAGHAGDRIDYARSLVPLGVRVLLAEYPGYGARGGSHGERAFVADALQTIALARQRYDGPLILVGESLGAGVAAAAAVQRPGDVTALLLITPWDRLVNVAQHHHPWLPVRWLLRDRYDSASHLSAVPLPVVVAVAGQDGIVPARYGVALHAAAAGPKRLIVIPGADHNDWPGHVDAAWWRDALMFLGAGPR